MRTRVKICGITRTEDALAVAQSGADAMGLVFYPPSPRHVEPAVAAEIVAALPPFVTVVGLFVNEDPARIQAILDQVPLDLLQFHGDESPADCARLGHPYIKAIRMADGVDVAGEAERYATARGLLLDTFVPGTPGGTGQAFNWDRAPRNCPKPIILAGGLTPDNVAAAIAQTRPFAVDVSGGVEASKGIKDSAKITAFVRQTQQGEV